MDIGNPRLNAEAPTVAGRRSADVRAGLLTRLAPLLAAIFVTGCTAAVLTPTPAPTSSTAPPVGAPAAASATPSATVTPSASATATTAPATATPTVKAIAANCTARVTTPAQTEGPYYKANPPERASLLEPGMPGAKLTVTGKVYTSTCQPVAGARMDFWHANDSGQYDNAGYRLRGYQLTQADGVYRLETIVPGLYPGRTRHIHVKAGAPNGAILTTQVYFPGEPLNSGDPIFDARLVMDMTDGADGKVATFDFVLPAS